MLYTAGRVGLFSSCVLILALSVGNVSFLWVSCFICFLFISVQHFWIARFICLLLCPVGVSVSTLKLILVQKVI